MLGDRELAGGRELRVRLLRRRLGELEPPLQVISLVGLWMRHVASVYRTPAGKCDDAPPERDAIDEDGMELRSFETFDQLVDAVTRSTLASGGRSSRSRSPPASTRSSCQRFSGFTQAEPGGYWLAEFQVPDKMAMRLEPAVTT